jgi:hypothetical protein
VTQAIVIARSDVNTKNDKGDSILRLATGSMVNSLLLWHDPEEEQEEEEQEEEEEDEEETEEEEEEIEEI